MTLLKSFSLVPPVGAVLRNGILTEANVRHIGVHDEQGFRRTNAITLTTLSRNVGFRHCIFAKLPKGLPVFRIRCMRLQLLPSASLESHPVSRDWFPRYLRRPKLPVNIFPCYPLARRQVRLRFGR